MTILSPDCRCGHALAVHNPCSKCECPRFTPGKAKKYPPRKAAER